MILSAPDKQHLKIKADSYESIQCEKSRSQLKNAFNHLQRTKQITLELEKISSNQYDNAFVNQILKDQLTTINRFDAVVDIRVKDLLSFHYDGTLISQFSKLKNKETSRNNQTTKNAQSNKENMQQTERNQILENHIIYIDYIVYNEFEINVSFRILNDISPDNLDNKQVIETIFYHLSHMINFSLQNVLSIENIQLTQMRIKICKQQFKIDCSFGKVKFHALLQDEGSSFSYCIIRLMKIFVATEIDLYVDEDTMHELLEHLFHEDNRLKSRSISILKIKAYSKLEQKKWVSLLYDSDKVKVEYNSDSMQIPSYTFENLFSAFDENKINIVFKEIKSLNFLKELKRMLKYANVYRHQNLEISCQNQEFFISRTQDNNQYAKFEHDLSFSGNDFSMKEISKNSFIVSQYPEVDCSSIGESVNKYIISILTHINVSVYRYFYFIDTPDKIAELEIKKQEINKIQELLQNKQCLSNVLDVRINNKIINPKQINQAKHALLAFLKQLKSLKKLNLLRKEVISEIFLLFLKQKE